MFRNSHLSTFTKDHNRTSRTNPCNARMKQLCFSIHRYPNLHQLTMTSSPRNLSLWKQGAGIQRRPLKQFYVYILCSKQHGTLYIGVTSDLIKRVYEHKNDFVEGFTRKYHVHRLVWYEIHESWESAGQREKQIKKWKRAWKLNLIEKNNPSWDDLYESICGWGLWIPASAGMTSLITMSTNGFPDVHK